jgi:hypothetical protein
MSEKIGIYEDGKKKTITKQQAIVKAITSKSVKGDPRAQRLMVGLIALGDAKVQAQQKKHDKFIQTEAYRQAIEIIEKRGWNPVLLKAGLEEIEAKDLDE